MSVSASINIKLVMLDGKMISSADIINRLLRCNWTINDNGNISFLPLGDNDDYDWQNKNINLEQLMNIIVEKEKQNEVIGVTLMWGKTRIGGQLLIWQKGNLSINLTVNRKILNDNTEIDATDVNWYLERILPAFKGGNCIVETVTFEQHL